PLADLDKEAGSLVLLEDAVRYKYVPLVDVEPEAMAAVAPERAFAIHTAVIQARLYPAGFPVAVDRFPTVALPNATGVDVSDALRRSADVATARDSAAQ